ARGARDPRRPRVRRRDRRRRPGRVGPRRRRDLPRDRRRAPCRGGDGGVVGARDLRRDPALDARSDDEHLGVRAVDRGARRRRSGAPAAPGRHRSVAAVGPPRPRPPGPMTRTWVFAPWIGGLVVAGAVLRPRRAGTDPWLRWDLPALAV